MATHHTPHLSEPEAHGASHGTLGSYVIGFIMSLLITVASYLMVTQQLAMGGLLVAGVITLALMQLAVQLVYFLHVGQGSNRAWNLAMLAFAILTVITVVTGSLWVMYHLGQGMTPGQMSSYISSQDGL